MAEVRDPHACVQRRSSSQTSTTSGKSQKGKTVRSKTRKRHSASSSSNAPTDLTSFPSLSPESSPEGFRGEPALNHALSQALLAEDGVAGNLDRGRKATLAGLTTSLPQISGRTALFDDSVSSRDVPGALHLANDDHIERLIARKGAVKLIRQFARDLALRDAEISALRLRADDREKELKKMLRELQVSSQDIERRLFILENPVEKPIQSTDRNGVGGSSEIRRPSSGLDGMMGQAMLDEVGIQVFGGPADETGKIDLQATIRPHRNESDARSGCSSLESMKKKRSGSIRGWQDNIWGSGTVSRKTSRASSVMSELGEQNEGGGELRIPNPSANRRKALDEQLFQPPGGTESAGLASDGNGIVKPGNGDDGSIRSRASSRSLASWTVRLFAGKPQPGKEANNSDNPRSRPSSAAPDNKKRSMAAPTSAASSNVSGAAVAALKRINGAAGVQPLSGTSSATSSVAGSMRVSTTGSRRSMLPNTIQGALPEPRTPDDSSTNHGPVEMDTILPLESRPPTLTHTYGNHQPGEFLTDRFGFIYDQRRKKRQKEATMLSGNSNSATAAETIISFRGDLGADANDGIGDIEYPTSPSIEEIETGTSASRRWQDYLKIATKPTELLSHTPAAGPIVSLATAEDVKPRVSSVAIDKSGSLSVVNTNPHPSALTSPVTSNRAEFAGTPTPQISVLENEPVKLLLERLTDLHDSLQRERTVKWNEFMRKVRAERRREGEAAAATPSDRPSMSLAMPETSLADGEVVGIAGLGTKGKVGRAKWREFRSLVLGGIPVAYRAKIWSECSGASALRVPGCYDDLVAGSTTSNPDPSVVAQIEMDIHRTLTDNVFFRKGPGVAKLNEVLLAYSHRNPEVGYCQGMNLIAGSLLLIMPTAEDAFWVLASMIENILPDHYYDHGLLASRADQQVLRQYVSEILPKLSAHLDELGIELEALTFQWFLSVFTDCLSAEALYRVWDVVLCLNTPGTASLTQTYAAQIPNQNSPENVNSNTLSLASLISSPTGSSATSVNPESDLGSNGGGGSTFFFQVALALLKLNEHRLLTTCSTAAAVYTYINHQMTNHAISIDGLIQASDALRNVVRREDVLARRASALREIERDKRP